MEDLDLKSRPRSGRRQEEGGAEADGSGTDSCGTCRLFFPGYRRMSSWAELKAVQKKEQSLKKRMQRKRRWIKEVRTEQSWSAWSV